MGTWDNWILPISSSGRYKCRLKPPFTLTWSLPGCQRVYFELFCITKLQFVNTWRNQEIAVQKCNELIWGHSKKVSSSHIVCPPEKIDLVYFLIVKYPTQHISLFHNSSTIKFKGFLSKMFEFYVFMKNKINCQMYCSQIFVTQISVSALKIQTWQW